MQTIATLKKKTMIDFKHFHVIGTRKKSNSLIQDAVI